MLAWIVRGYALVWTGFSSESVRFSLHFGEVRSHFLWLSFLKLSFFLGFSPIKNSVYIFMSFVTECHIDLTLSDFLS